MNILYVCTHNRCRSILSEAITNQKGKGVLTAISAGSSPADKPHPLTLKYLQEAGYAVTGLSSKSWHALEGVLKFAPDVVVMVCDSANAELCPVWLGDSIKLHWNLIDPSKIAEDATGKKCSADILSADLEIRTQFEHTIQTIERRVDQLLTIAELPKEQWQKQLIKLLET